MRVGTAFKEQGRSPICPLLNRILLVVSQSVYMALAESTHGVSTHTAPVSKGLINIGYVHAATYSQRCQRQWEMRDPPQISSAVYGGCPC